MVTWPPPNVGGGRGGPRGPDGVGPYVGVGEGRSVPGDGLGNEGVGGGTEGPGAGDGNGTLGLLYW
jgi:hypothetical protein